MYVSNLYTLTGLPNIPGTAQRRHLPAVQHLLTVIQDPLPAVQDKMEKQTGVVPTDMEPRAILMRIAMYASIPMTVMMWLIDDAGIIETVEDLPLIPTSEVLTLHDAFLEQYADDVTQCKIWLPVMSN